MKKIYVGNLSWGIADAELKEFFANYGTVHTAAVITDRETGRSRGFGFVEMEPAEAENAIREADGKELDGRALRVNEAQERQRRPQRDRW